MTLIYIPYHLDELLPDLNVPLPNGFGGDPGLAEVNVDLASGEDLWVRLSLLYEAVAQTIAPLAGQGSMIPVVSGDCTVTAGIAAGLQRAGIDPAIVWFDAHGDLQTVETSTSGYIGGMALRFLLGYRPDLLTGSLGLRPVAEERVLLVDGRDLDPPEVDYLASARVRQLAVGELTAEALPGLLPDGPLLVNLDLDIIDPGDLPGLRYPAPGGPGLDAVAKAAQAVIDTGRVAAINIACTWHPGHTDSDGVRERLLSTLLRP